MTLSTMSWSKKSCELKNFIFQNGTTLPLMTIEYGTLGNPITDSRGNVTNALIFCHGWSGNYEQIELAKDLVGPGKIFDTDRLFIICPSAIGSPGSSAPSTSGLGPQFPIFTIGDMVKSQYLLIHEQLGITRLLGVVGSSMGGFQTMEWAVTYPDFMEFIIPVATSYECCGRLAGIFSLVSKTISEDPAYKHGEYKHQPSTAMDRAFITAYLWFMSPQYYKDQYQDPESLFNGLLDIGLGNGKADANDFIWRNKAMLSYNTEDRLHHIKAKCLFIGVRQDELFPLETDVVPLAMAVAGSQLFIYDSVHGHAGAMVDLIKAGTVIKEFIAKFID